MRVLACGEQAVLVELDRPDQVLPLRAALLAERAELAVEELVPAERTLLIRVPPGADLPRLTAAVRQLHATLPDPPGAGASKRAGPTGGDALFVDVRYDGPDLAEAARLTGRAADDLIAVHTGIDWTVAFCGFAPGFGYLRAAGDPLTVARRDSPRDRIPAGAVALGGHFSAVYPRTSPGGWRLIGHTDLKLWDTGRDRPALLTPGIRVRFRAVRIGASP